MKLCICKRYKISGKAYHLAGVFYFFLNLNIFPDGTTDLLAVNVALDWLNEVDENTHYVCLLKEVGTLGSVEDLEDEVDNWVVNVYQSKRKPQMILTDVSLEKEAEVNEGLKAFLFKVSIFSSR